METAPELQATDPDANYKSAFYAREKGMVLGLRRRWSRLGGDFDGDTQLVGPDTITLADPDDSAGTELAIGGVDHGNAVLLTYARVRHPGELGGAPADVLYRAISIDVQHYFRANEATQPYALLGLVVPWVDLQDASSDGGPPGDADLRSGFGVKLGGGFAWWLTRNLALDLRAQYDLQWFDRAEGVSGDSEKIDDPVDGRSLVLSVGISWVLGGPP